MGFVLLGVFWMDEGIGEACCYCVVPDCLFGI